MKIDEIDANGVTTRRILGAELDQKDYRLTEADQIWNLKRQIRNFSKIVVFVVGWLLLLRLCADIETIRSFFGIMIFGPLFFIILEAIFKRLSRTKQLKIWHLVLQVNAQAKQIFSREK